MKVMLSACFIAGLFFSGLAQTVSATVIGSAGDYYQNPSGFNLHWTIGEVAISNFEEDGLIISEGFHQTYFSVIVSWENPEAEWHINVFPNPAKDWIIIDSDSVDDLNITLSNISGKQVLHTTLLASEKKEINIQTLPSGTYLLSLSNDKQLLKTYKILKH